MGTVSLVVAQSNWVLSLHTEVEFECSWIAYAVAKAATAENEYASAPELVNAATCPAKRAVPRSHRFQFRSEHFA